MSHIALAVTGITIYGLHVRASCQLTLLLLPLAHRIQYLLMSAEAGPGKEKRESEGERQFNGTLVSRTGQHKTIC